MITETRLLVRYLYCSLRPHWSPRWGARAAPCWAAGAAAAGAWGRAAAPRRTAGTAARPAGAPAAPPPPRTAAAAPAARPPAPCRAAISCRLTAHPCSTSAPSVQPLYKSQVRPQHYAHSRAPRTVATRVLWAPRRARHCDGAPGGGAAYPPYSPLEHKLILRLLHIIDLFLRQYIAPAAKRFQTLCREVTDLYWITAHKLREGIHWINGNVGDARW